MSRTGRPCDTYTHHLRSVDITECCVCVSEKYADEMNMQKPDTERYTQNQKHDKNNIYWMGGLHCQYVCCVCGAAIRSISLYDVNGAPAGRARRVCYSAYRIFLLSLGRRYILHLYWNYDDIVALGDQFHLLSLPRSNHAPGSSVRFRVDSSLLYIDIIRLLVLVAIVAARSMLPIMSRKM